MRTPTISGYDGSQTGLQIIQGNPEQKLGQILEGKIAFSASDINLFIKTMLWDVYEEMSELCQLHSREELKKREDSGDIAGALLEAIAMLNIERYLSELSPEEAKKFSFGTDEDKPVDAVDYMMSDQSCGFSKYQDLFFQVKEFKNTGKLNPPTMYTLGRVETAKQDGKRALIRILNEYKEDEE